MLDELISLREISRRTGIPYATLRNRRDLGNFIRPDVVSARGHLWKASRVATYLSIRPPKKKSDPRRDTTCIFLRMKPERVLWIRRTSDAMGLCNAHLIADMIDYIKGGKLASFKRFSAERHGKAGTI